MLIGLNNENPSFHNVFEFDLVTNEMRLIFRNNRFPAKIVVDNALKIRMVFEESFDGSLHYYKCGLSVSVCVQKLRIRLSVTLVPFFLQELHLPLSLLFLAQL